MIRRVAVLILLIGGALLLEPLRVPSGNLPGARSLFLFGVLLLAADTLGELMHELGVPRIVGYILAGIAIGPSVGHIVPLEVAEDMSMMKRLAIGLISLLAGVELRLHDLKRHWRTVAGTVGGQSVVVPAVILAGVVVARPWIPWLDGFTMGEVLLVGFLFASMLTVNSPMVTIALLSETHARGPVAKVTLGNVLVADVVVIILFTIALGLAEGALGGGGTTLRDSVGALMAEVVGSIVAGAIIAGAVALYIRFVKLELILFAVVVVFATDAAAQVFHFELLLSLVVAGFLVENVAPVRTEPLVRTLKSMGWPVFVVFFALAGVELPLGTFLTLWPIIAAFSLLRAGGLWFSGWIGGRIGQAKPAVRRYAWLGLVSQAGVALGLATIVAERFPKPGAVLQATVVGIIALNQTVGPILFRRALDLAGEVPEPGKPLPDSDLDEQEDLASGPEDEAEPVPVS